MHRYSYSRRVQWSECDPAGIIFFAQYAYWVSDGLMAMFLDLGVDPTAAPSDGQGTGLPSVRAVFNFLGVARLHETVQHEIEVMRLGSSSLDFRHRVFRNSACIMEAEERRVWVEANGINLRPVPVPERVRLLLGAETDSEHS